MSRSQAAILAALLVLAAALRVHRLDEQSLWTDEFHSLFAATGRSTTEAERPCGIVLTLTGPPSTSLEGAPPWWRIWGAPNGNPHGNPHPPLYFLALRAWRVLFGDGDAALRSLSVAASLVALACLYDLMRTLHGPTVALWGALLMALSPIQVYYAQEVRGYTLALALALGAGAALARIERGGHATARLSLAFGASVLGCALTHYFAAGVLPALGAYAALRLGGRARARVLATLALAAVAFAAAWGPYFLTLHEAPLHGFPGFEDFGPGHAVRTLRRVVGVPWIHLTTGERWALEPPVWGAVLLLGAILLVGPGRGCLLWILWLLGTIGIVAGHDLANRTYQLSLTRFTLFASPATYALIALVVSRRPAWLGHGFPAVAAAIAVAHLPASYGLTKHPWRELARAVDQEIAAGDLVVIDASPMFDMRPGVAANGALRAVAHYARLQGREVLLTESGVGPELEAILARYDAVWLLSAAPPRAPGLLAGKTVSEVFQGEGVPSLWRVTSGDRGAGASVVPTQAPR